MSRRVHNALFLRQPCRTCQHRHMHRPSHVYLYLEHADTYLYRLRPSHISISTGLVIYLYLEHADTYFVPPHSSLYVAFRPHVHVCVCTWVCLCLCLSLSVCLSVCLSVYVCMYTYIHTCIHTYMHTYIHTYIHTHYMYTCIYVYMCIHIVAFTRARRRYEWGATYELIRFVWCPFDTYTLISSIHTCWKMFIDSIHSHTLSFSLSLNTHASDSIVSLSLGCSEQALLLFRRGGYGNGRLVSLLVYEALSY